MFSALPATLTGLTLIRDGSVPLYRQIYDHIRQAILQQQLEAGLRLPSTRDLASSLAVSRNTVRNAFDQLLAEGYLETGVGSGTFVCRELPDMRPATPSNKIPPEASARPRPLSRFGQAMAEQQRIFATHARFASRPGGHFTFEIGVPALDAVPLAEWAKLAKQVQQQLPSQLLRSVQGAAGYLPLRTAIATHLKATRAVRCEPEQVIITTGSQKGLYLAGQILLNVGDTVWLEDPGYAGARSASLMARAKLVHVPVDEQGLIVPAGVKLAPTAKVAWVTPSHHYPLGGTMSLARRLQLIDWANTAGAWIVEDDYDSEFRFAGPPLASLQGLDAHKRVIYVGTFSKVLFPSLRLGYLIVPPDLVDAFTGLITIMETHYGLLNQVVLARFMADGYFARHVRRMRRLYAKRSQILLAEMAHWLGDVTRPGPANCGMHVVFHLPPHLQDKEIAAKARPLGLGVMAISGLFSDPAGGNGLLMGFANDNEAQIKQGVAKLAQAIRQF